MATMYDAIIIGTGQAGPYLARRLTAAGMKVAITQRSYSVVAVSTQVAFLLKP
jgi:pyruvate/2-oxoglutarate dehydrogenase complex dihydrolipoamide dehydrogenase (E3) component